MQQPGYYQQGPAPQAPLSVEQAVDMEFPAFLNDNARKMSPYVYNWIQQAWANQARGKIIADLYQHLQMGRGLNTQIVRGTIANWANDIANGIAAQQRYYPPVQGQNVYPQQQYSGNMQVGYTPNNASGATSLSNLNVNTAQMQQQANIAAQQQQQMQVQQVQQQPIPVGQPTQNLQPSPQIEITQGTVFMSEEKETLNVETPFASGTLRVCENVKEDYKFKFMKGTVTKTWGSIFSMASEIIRYFGSQDFIANLTYTQRLPCPGVKVDDAKTFVELLKDAVRDFKTNNLTHTTLISNIKEIRSAGGTEKLANSVFNVFSHYIMKMVHSGIFTIDKLSASDETAFKDIDEFPIQDYDSLILNRPGDSTCLNNGLEEKIPNYAELWNHVFNYAVIHTIENMEVADPNNLRELADVFNYVNLNAASNPNDRVMGFRIFNDPELNRERCLEITNSMAVIYVHDNHVALFRTRGCHNCFNENAVFPFGDEPYSCEFEYAFNRILRSEKLDRMTDIVVINKSAMAHLYGLAIKPGVEYSFARAIQ